MGLALHQEAPRTRSWYLDHLKVALTILVIFHHVGQAYGPTGGFWYYNEPQRWTYLGSFFYINASFFMGLFFFLSAYFLPGSYDRKGWAAFLRDRALRLGIPLILFLLVVNPILMYVSFMAFRGGVLPFGQYLTQIYFGVGPQPPGWFGPTWPELNFGHLWFVEHLLVYALLYILWRRLRPGSTTGPSAVPANPPSDGLILGFVVALTLVSAVVRIWYPIDRWIGFLGFIQMEPAHLPQYASFFLLGLHAARTRWLESMPASRGARWLGVGLTGAAIVVSLNWVGGLMPPMAAGLVRLTAESMIAVGLSLGLLVLFRDRLAETKAGWRVMASNAYGAYLFHVPVAVALQYAAAGLPVGPSLKFLVVGVASVVGSFVVSHLLRQLPGLRSIL